MSVLRVSTGRSVQLRINDELGRGAQGAVYMVADSEHVCAKVYFTHSSALAPRLEALTQLPPLHWGGDCPEHVHVAWPRAVLLDADGAVCGVVMPRVNGAPLLRLLDPVRRIEVLDEPTWRTNLTVASRVARLFEMLHGAGVVIGDVSPSNLIVDRHGHVTLIDCDGVQFTDPRSGELYRGEKFTPEYAAPEVLRDPGRPLSPEHDLFGLAVMICQLLMEGEHPFEGVSTAHPPSISVADNIKLQNNRVTRPERLVPLTGGIPVDSLPVRIRDLMVQCFDEGYDDPSRRPPAQIWADELGQVAFELMGCRHNPRHAYHRSAPSCLWCARVQAGFGEHFPPPPGWSAPAQQQAVPSTAAQHTLQYPPPPLPGQVPQPSAPAPVAKGGRRAVKILLVVLAVLLVVILVATALG